MTNPLPVLKFSPILKPAPWGGRKLEVLFHKVLPAAVPCGESWEVVDLPGDQSEVAAGPLAATNLQTLVNRFPEDLLGETGLLLGRFPLLFKFIDASHKLSVQVHPDDRSAARMGGGARPKAEAWYIVDAEPGAKLYLGLREGVDHAAFLRGLDAGQVEDLLHAIEVRAGQFYYLPGGLLHAIGGGIVLAEIQQASDTTFRVFDWNRLGLDGRPRELHRRQALEAIRYDLRGLVPSAPPASGRPGVRCEHFVFERAGLSAGAQTPVEGGRPRIVACVEGAGQLLDSGQAPVELVAGESCLVPACLSAQLASRAGGVFLVIRA